MKNSDEMLRDCGAVMYDIEIISAVPNQGEVRDPKLFYCLGWEDYAGMGVSVISAYDYVEQAYRIYLQDNFHEFKTLVNSRNIIIGFNNDRFDNNVVREIGIPIPKTKSYDMWKAIVATQPDGGRKGFKLNNLLVANNIESKTGLGADAPMLAQTGQWGKLINYCQDDTRKQVQVLRLLCSGILKNPNGGGYMKVKTPWELIQVEPSILS